MFISDFTQLNGPVFGYHPEDMVPRPYNFRGMRGWFTLPFGWSLRTNPGGWEEASPYSDFSRYVVVVETHDDGTKVFQDLKLGTSHRDIGTNGIPVPNW